MSLILKIKLMYPKFLAVILILLSMTPLKIYGATSLLSMVDIMFIYYWCIYKPQLVQDWFVFAMGILRDAISGAPLGINALANLILRSLVLYKREKYVKQPFIIIWQGFAVFAAILQIFKWIAFSIIFDKILTMDVMIIQLLLSAAIYPLFHLLFNMVFAIIPKDSLHA